MQHRMSLAVVTSLLMVAMLPGVAAAQDETRDVSLLFVVSTTSGSIDGDTLTLDAVPSVLWFTDRPERHAGHMEPAAFANVWTEGQDSSANDPPNAVLSILDEDTTNDAVVELTSVASLTDSAGAGDDMAFTFEVLEGELPQGAIGTASLFIDSFIEAFASSRTPNR